jgi:hypothetical protein
MVTVTYFKGYKWIPYNTLSLQFCAIIIRYVIFSFFNSMNFPAEDQEVIYTMTAITDKKHALITSPRLGPFDNYSRVSTSKLKDNIQNP